MIDKMIKWGTAGVLLLLTAVIFFWPPGRTWTLTLPEPEKLESVVLTRGMDSAAVSGTERLFEILTGTERKTKEESIQDFPVNAKNVIQIDFHFKERGASTIFAYEKGRGYFIEQPYNGIYRITEEEFQEISDILEAL